VRRLAIVNLAAAVAVAAFGIYVWRLTVTRRVTVTVKSWWTPAGEYHALAFLHTYRVTTHTHAALAYAAWAVALLGVLIAVWQLRKAKTAAASISPAAGGSVAPS
jgi:hypothetical protein